MTSRPHRSTLFPYTTLFRSSVEHRSRRLVHVAAEPELARGARLRLQRELAFRHAAFAWAVRRHGQRADRQDGGGVDGNLDRKSTRLNSSHLGISYAVFCLKK